MQYVRNAFVVPWRMPYSEPKPSEWSEKHIAEHNVTMDEVAQLLAAPHIESPGRDDTVICAGTTAAGVT